MTIKRFWLLGLVLVAAMLLAPLAVAALPPALPAPSIISLRMSDTPDGPAKEQFPQGIGQVFAIVEYADMQDTPVLLKTYDGRGNVLVSETRTLSGEGQVALSIPVVFGSGGFLTNIYIQIEAPLYSQTGGFLATSAEWTVGSGELAEAAAPSSSEQPEPPASSLASPAVLAQPEVPEHLPFGPPSTEAQEPYPLPGRILVTLKRDVPFEALANEHARLRTEVVRRWPLQHAVRVRVPEGQEDKFIEIYKKKPNVLRATRVWAGAVQHGEPNDEYWAWHGQWPKRRMHLPEIWDYEPGSANTVVAVFDFSFYLEHQDVNYWSNPDEIPDNGLDDDNNGFVDDIVGWDFCNQPECEGPGDNDPGLESGETGYNHGVAMAGVCCSHTNNVEGVAGTGFYGPQAMLVKVGFYDESIGGYWATDDALAEGLHYATDNEAVAASLSISVGGYCDVIGPAAQYAWDHGLFMVGAAGNEVPYGNKDCGEWG
ncbi:MAG: S8 family serine peptidase, partial [Anaerolineae bacterium]